MKNKFHVINKQNADHYGYDSQSTQCIEECAELIQAINKRRRIMGIGQPTKISKTQSYKNLVEEIADVEVMLEQIIHLEGIERKEIDKIKKMKIKRTVHNIFQEFIKDVKQK